ncbi:isoprenylcysteine carboxylmethyltransferase family protein [bacterium (Candidatus Blackallbacteria) CG17_big_fil_post_rev_8_21_14_2_50_48_46]|uniref:Isoprenylcysteine carboxylmethyltransferase family protein n=1 Tax=bacterium (Candidatus Blackallbacteria) CG17_big_fil_post_rev_8_21_14_2_50_48_46 TaxID=2014261 RepID=A0A2M7GA82_9BACT|nr:MAG: isoprenylcysteine carboxyl methyltransferase [bacterium (Candidatus Blackallbacteria) CG18_big_fil_WC_8_21_14_2_50_49_26]PIW19050.1 MAG: isoprenylcysteine carboxylmethyltransferase family protein [bacterium (Candidatus Blackallbacteria) CG17_big_fil_post_rev_8_21_14_2_50_48_46]PIW44583.1 MAG: isoprenylcysteine carboxylmethyltransferase family protein [bacterium (Candidatus Blackallbacteria) CG13_big_fil_rev_8_21_14_2_50_49_14]
MQKSKAIIASYLGLIFFSAFIFLGAGKLWYWQGFLYLVAALIGTTFNHLLLPKGSTLTEERMKTAQNGLDWDKKILGLTFILSLVTFFVAGLDSGRFHWTGKVPLSLTVIGVLLLLTGQLIFAFAKRENAFFSSTVRLQTEIGHQVCASGLYRVVRHPGYLGLILANLGFPLIMNAYTAFLPTLLGIALILLRTQLEDRFLNENLEGYRAYAQKTPYRLIPWVY